MTLALAFALATRSRHRSASPAGACCPSSPLYAKPSREHEALGDRDNGISSWVSGGQP
jgi:hypothetical protein